MKKILFFVCLTLVVASCAKSKAKKNIVGTWYEVKINETDVPVGAQDQIKFEKIKGGEGKMTIIDAYGAVEPIEYTYNIEDGGTKLVIQTFSSGFGSVKSTRTIKEITETTLKIDWGSSAYIGTYSK